MILVKRIVATTAYIYICEKKTVRNGLVKIVLKKSNIYLLKIYFL